MITNKGGKVLSIGDKVKYRGKQSILVCLSDTSFTLCPENSKDKKDIKTYKGDPYFYLFKERVYE